MARFPLAPGRLRRRPAAPAVGATRPPLTGELAPPIVGLSPAGDPVRTEASTGVVVFMTSSCLACREVWSALAVGAAASLQCGPIVVVTPDPTLEERRSVAALAPEQIPVLMSSEAWVSYRAGPAPWVAVLSEGRVVAEGPAAGWADVVALARVEAR